MGVWRVGGSVAAPGLALAILAGCAEAPPTISEAEWSAAFAPVCSGQPAATAADYSSASAPHPIVVIGAAANTTYVPALPFEWRPATVQEAQLVACLEIERTEIERCPYIGGSDIVRYQYAIGVSLRAARTGEVVGSTELQGDAAPPCPAETGVNVTTLGSPPYDKLSEWLAPRVSGTE